MNNENQTENLKIESLQEIAVISELNSNLSQFQVINEFIKQSVMYITLKKGKKEIISEEDLSLFNHNFNKMKNIIDSILKN